MSLRPIAFSSLLAAAVLLAAVPVHAQNYQNDIKVTASWMASSAVTLSDGAVMSGANAGQIIPYFSNLGVHGFAKDSTYYNNIQNYMEWYWKHVGWPLTITPSGCTTNPPSGQLYGAIDDFTVTSNGTETPMPDSPSNHHPDSTDAYAGTFLSLAYAYWQTGNANAQAYIKLITTGAQGDRLDYIGEVVLATLQSNNLTCARPDYNIEYLEDNAEAYRGLQDLVSLYKALGVTTKANYYSAYVGPMGTAISSGPLWDKAGNEFYTYTTVSGASGTVDWTQWYGIYGSVSEIFPIALGVISPTSSEAQQIWTTFQNHWRTKWINLTADSTGYPWTIVGYTAALMGDTADANAFIKNVEQKYVNTNFTGGPWSVNEAGYFIRLCAML